MISSPLASTRKSLHLFTYNFDLAKAVLKFDESDVCLLKSNGFAKSISFYSKNWFKPKTCRYSRTLFGVVSPPLLLSYYYPYYYPY
jgi:hypothetical protein